MSSQLKQLYKDNKKMSGGGNIKQGLAPSATGLTMLSYALPRYSGHTQECKAYDGVTLVPPSGVVETIGPCPS